MKPIIIFTQKDENGNISMSAEEFEKHIQTAYDSGVQDGRGGDFPTTMRGNGLGGTIPCADAVSITNFKAAESAQCSAYNAVT